jgi:hypothetical protein
MGDKGKGNFRKRRKKKRNKNAPAAWQRGGAGFHDEGKYKRQRFSRDTEIDYG